MQALVLTGANQFELQDVPAPIPGDQDVLIAIEACGICGSDVHGMDGSTGRRQPPIIMGHEASGVIVETGREVERWQPGDRVTFDSTVYCGVCDFCRRGAVNLCDARRVLGVSCDDYRRHGAFAEFVAVPARILYRLPDKVSFAQGAMVEPVSIAVHAAARTPLALNDTAVVVGAGVIGLLVIQTLRAAGCGRILAVDVDAGRLELARRAGATEAVHGETGDPVAVVQNTTGGRGADVAFEAVGLSSTLQTAVSVLRKGGALTLIGNVTPMVEFPMQAVVTRELSVFGSCASNGEYPACLDLMADGRIDVDMLINASAPLAEGADWFRRLQAREPGLVKVILEPRRKDTT